MGNSIGEITMDEEQLKALLAGFKDDILGEVKTQMTDTLAAVDKKNSGLASSLTKEFKNSTSSILAEVRGSGAGGTGDGGEGTPAGGGAGGTNPDDNGTPSQKSKLTLKALKTEIESLRAENLRKEQQLSVSSRNSELSSLFNAKKANFPDRAVKAFLLEHGGDLKQEEGVWFLSKGEDVVSIGDAVDSFLQSDFGSTFVQASKGKGMGLKPANTAPPSKDGKPTLNTTLFAVEE